MKLVIEIRTCQNIPDAEDSWPAVLVGVLYRLLGCVPRVVCAVLVGPAVLLSLVMPDIEDSWLVVRAGML